MMEIMSANSLSALRGEVSRSLYESEILLALMGILLLNKAVGSSE
jgi:hypothetical protein